MQQILDLNQIDDRSAESFAFAKRVYKPYGQLGSVIEWCKTNLSHDWRWQMVSMPSPTTPGDYIFYFDNEQDCFKFTLRWV